MSELSSFYGGRQGAAFVIVKRFDGIDIPQPGDGSGVADYTYTASIYAVNAAGEFIITTDPDIGNVLVDESSGSYLIEKTHENYVNYAWVLQSNNGTRIPNTNFRFPRTLAEGMVQCFAKGVKSSSEVNYGEYVIIDTMKNMKGQNDPDNGKVFRRGMNIDSSLAGAEYIGQIVGPQGESPELEIESESKVKEHAGARSDEYTPGDGDLIPGYGVPGAASAQFLGTYYEDVYEEILSKVQYPSATTLYSVVKGSTQEYEYYRYSNGTWTKQDIVYNDNISYSWMTVRDEYGNVNGCLIGFTVPYLVETFTATAVDAYYHRDSEGVPFRNMNLIERVDDGKHPYYQSWRIRVPEGIKGDTITKLEKIDTQVKAGVDYFYDRQLIDKAGTTSGIINLDTDAVNYTAAFLPVTINGELYYIANNSQNMCTSILRYTETNYDRNATGDTTFVPIGAYNTIKSIWIEDNGDVYIDYSYDNVKKLEDVHLKWIDRMVIEQNGHYVITYNDGTTDEGDIRFIDKIQILDDGTVVYTYNDGTEAGRQTKLMRWIQNVTVDGRDGNGSQQVVVTYNNDAGTAQSEAIGDPINYILEAVISESREESTSTKPFHLLVLYSDPVRRAEIIAQGKNALYRSQYPNSSGQYLRNDWHDLGDVRGAKGGLGILTKLADEALLNDDSADAVPIPPEYMGEAIKVRATGEPYEWEEGVGIDPQKAGWLVGVDAGTELDPDAMDVYFYDYTLETWVKVSGFSGGGAAAAQVVRISSTVPSDPELEEDGIWFGIEQTVFAK